MRLPIILSMLVLLAAGCAASHDFAVLSLPVDVTGVWVGGWSDGTNSTTAIIELQQTGSAVTGSSRIFGNARRSGALQGTIVGDHLSYRGVTADFGAEFTVAGDEMRGYGTASGARGLFRREK